MKTLVLSSVFILVLVVKINCFKTLSALNSIVFTDVPPPSESVRSEYYYGKCATRRKTLLVHDHFSAKEIKGSLVIHGAWNITEEQKKPNCVYLRATSALSDMVRYKSYQFSVCFVKALYNYQKMVYVHEWYEWFVPIEMQDGIDWDIYFFLV